MKLDRVRLSAAIASIVSGIVGVLSLFGIVVDPATEVQIHNWLFLLTSIFAAVVPFLPSVSELIRRGQEKGI